MKRTFARMFAAGAATLAATTTAFAASQTWTNAPVSTSWTNVNNWVGKAVPGDVNVATANTVNGDLVTFNAPLSGGIGGAANPIVPDDATIVNGRSRRILGITFDTTNCGPYVIASPSAPVVTDGSSTLTTGYLYVSHNTGTNANGEPLGAIRINASVTNSQVVAVPMLVNLPSSTAGQYWLVNNSTNPGVQLIIGSITHAGATTRATQFNLDGTNTAPNIVTNLSEGTGNGTGGIQKNGPNTWVVAGPGVFNRVSPNDSTIAVNNGTLVAQDPASFGTTLTTVINVFTNATLRVDGVTLNQNVVTLNGGRLLVNGNATVNGVTIPNLANAFGIVATSNATDVVTLGSVANRVAGASLTSTLRFVGPGTVLMANANNFAGKFSLEAGTNQLSTDPNVLGQAAGYTIFPGAILDVTPFGASGYAFTPKSLTASGANATRAAGCTILADSAATVNMQSRAINLAFTPTSFTGDSGHPALFLAQGTFAFNGNNITVSNATATPLGAGTYQIVSQATGTISSSGAFVTTVTGAGLAAGTVGEIVASGNSLNLIVSVYTPKSLVWSGGDVNNPNNWDRLNSINWLNGVTPSTFNIYDQATFNSTGSAFPTSTLTNTMVPGNVVVDTSANDYTISGAGQIAGGALLTKKSAGTLFLNTANTYSGGTVISNGTVKIGIDNALPSTGYGDVTNVSPAIIDLNGFSDSVGALNGNGTVDVTSGGTSTFAVGANDNTGTFSGVIQNTSGTLTLLKSGLGSQTLTASNSFSGATIIDQGTLRASNTFALGRGADGVFITNGVLDVATNIVIAALNGAAGSVVNATTTTITNLVTITNGGTFGGVVAGRLGVLITGGTLRYNAANAYTNPTWVAPGAGLAFGNLGNVASPVILSNTATVNMPTANNPSANVNANFTVVDNAGATFSSANTANNYSGQFNGSSLATAIFNGGIMSIGGAYSFSNFLGSVIISNGTVRMFNAVGGGDNTTFNFIGTGGMFSRDANFIRLGALFGNGRIDNPSVTFGATYAIGAKNIDCSFQGTITGSNNIVKTGTGRLTLDGNGATITTDNSTYTNYQYASVLTYLNNTTVSNGVLAISVPNDLSYSPNITVATTNAVLDAMNMGYVSNFTDVNGPNAVLVTNGILTVVPATPNGTPQILGGIGFVKAAGVTNNGTINPGLAGFGGTLTVSNQLTVNAGATNYFDLSDDLTGVTRSSDVLKVLGNVVLSGNSVIGVGALNGNLKVGTYPVIKYTGSLFNESGVVPAGPVANLSVGGVMATASRATMVASNAAGEVDLIVVSLNNTNLTWTGDGVSNLWDIANSSTFTNFINPMQFYQMDNVTFDGTSSPTNNSVIIVGAVAPSTLVVNSATNFIFGGTGSIQGGVTLVKKNTGTLTLTNGANSFYGGTLISNGVLSVGMDSGNNQNDLALGSGPVTVAGGELRFGGNSGGVVTHSVSNSIILNGGTVRAQDGVQRLTNSIINVAVGGGTFVTTFATKNLIMDSPLVGTGNATISALATGTNAAGGQVILNNATNTINGSVIIATNGNLALVGAAGLSNSVTIDVQQGGTFDVTGRTNVAATLTLLSGQTLKGNGIVRGNIIMNTGSTLSPGASIGTLFITNTTATTVTLNGNTVMEINRSATPNCDRLVSITNVLGGTITVTNIGGALQLNDTFTLFTSTTNRGVFAVTNLPALSPGLGWSNSLASNGKLTVIAVVNTSPFTLTNSVNGNVLTLSWPVDHTGYRLQVQTNSLTTGLNTNSAAWFTVPGSTGVNTTNFIINPANGSVFYRLIYP